MPNYIKRGALIFSSAVIAFGMFVSFKQGETAAMLAFGVALLSNTLALLSIKGR